jgi:hypothetical protein
MRQQYLFFMTQLHYTYTGHASSHNNKFFKDHPYQVTGTSMKNCFSSIILKDRYTCVPCDTHNVMPEPDCNDEASCVLTICILDTYTCVPCDTHNMMPEPDCNDEAACVIPIQIVSIQYTYTGPCKLL